MTALRNVLFIMTDEHQAAAMSCAAHPVVKTSNLDRLAARGTRFLNAYTPSPICVPARAALATGRYVHRCSYWDNAQAYDGRVPGWGHVLQAAGIPVTSIGKLHYRNAEDPTGLDQQLLPMHIHRGIGQVWGSVRNPLPASRDSVGMLGQIGAGLSKYNQYDMDVAATASDWLSERATVGAPWAAFVSFVAPHFPLTVPQDYLDFYPADDMPLPPVRPECGYEVHPWVARMKSFEDSDSELGSDNRRRQAIAAYYALCTFVDAQIGRVLDALDASGQANETLIIYASDHGENLGMRGRWGKSVLYREATQVPMILAGPGVAAGALKTTPVNLIDIAPTMADAFNLPPDPAWPGRSLLRTAAEPDAPDAIAFSEYHAANSAAGGFMVANARWKYHHYVGYPPELFDLYADPLEEHNLAGDPAHADIETRMRRALFKICDPETVDAAAKADQDALVARFGGAERAFRTGPSGATPVPGA